MRKSNKVFTLEYQISEKRWLWWAESKDSALLVDAAKRKNAQREDGQDYVWQVVCPNGSIMESNRGLPPGYCGYTVDVGDFVKEKEVFCKDCRYLEHFTLNHSGDIIHQPEMDKETGKYGIPECNHERNYTIVKTWYGEKRSENNGYSPKVTNKNNDCKWFEGKK